MPAIQNPPASPTAPQTGTSQQWLENILPGIGNMTSSATGNIQSLLSGLPSTSQTRTANAYWGVGAGTPASGTPMAGGGNTGDINSFIGQRGTDLYGNQAQQNNQTGLQNLLSTIGSYTSPVLQNQGQQLQNSQFGQNLAQAGSQFNQSQGQQAAEFNQTNQLQQFQTYLHALGL